jgi:hypothetical protein
MLKNPRRLSPGAGCFFGSPDVSSGMTDENSPGNGPRLQIDIGRKLARKLRERGWSIERIADFMGKTPREVHDLFEEPKFDGDSKFTPGTPFPGEKK